MQEQTAMQHVAQNKDHAFIVVMECVAEKDIAILATVVMDRSVVMDCTLVFY